MSRYIAIDCPNRKVMAIVEGEIQMVPNQEEKEGAVESSQFDEELITIDYGKILSSV